MRVRGSHWAAILAAAIAGSGQAVAGEVVLAGRAAAGDGERPASLRLACDPEGRGLSASLTVPRSLGSPSGSEGPAAAAIRVAGAGGVRGVTASATETLTADGDRVVTVAGAVSGLDPLRGIAPALTEPGARITWTQAAPHGGNAPLVATVPVSEADAASAKAALLPCLGR